MTFKDVVSLPRDNLGPDTIPVLIDRYKSLRLEGLRVDPSAFGSNYEREIKFTHDDWLRRLTNPLVRTFVSLDFLSDAHSGSISASPGSDVLLGNEWLGMVSLAGPKILPTAASHPLEPFRSSGITDPPDLTSIQGQHVVYILVGMFVRPEHRRRGRGRRLVEAAMAAAEIEARRASAKGITVALEVHSSNQAGYSLYQKLGFIDFTEVESGRLDVSTTCSMKWEKKFDA